MNIQANENFHTKKLKTKKTTKPDKNFIKMYTVYSDIYIILKNAKIGEKLGNINGLTLFFKLSYGVHRKQIIWFHNTSKDK